MNTRKTNSTYLWKSSLALKGFWALTGEQWVKKGESAFGQVFTRIY